MSPEIGWLVKEVVKAGLREDTPQARLEGVMFKEMPKCPALPMCANRETRWGSDNAIEGLADS